MTDNMPQETRDELIKIMEACDHSCDWTAFPDSLASMCNDCGQMFIWVGEGKGCVNDAYEPWEYRSGNVNEWLYDIYGAPDDK